MDKRKFILFAIICLFSVQSCKKHTVLSSVKIISAFDFLKTFNNMLDKDDYAGVISNDTIYLKLNEGTNLTNLNPSITFSGKSISPSNLTPQNFTSPVKYIVTAEDGTSISYVVIVSLLSSKKTIINFSFKSIDNRTLPSDYIGKIGNDTIIVAIPGQADLTQLIPTINFIGQTLTPQNRVIQNFSAPVNYSVTAEDGTVKKYTVIVTTDATLFVGSGAGNLYALDPISGYIKWQINFQGDQLSTPTYADGYVFVGSSSGKLRVIDAKTGYLKWIANYVNGSVYTIPTIHNNIVFIINYTSPSLFEFDEFTGNLILQKQIDVDVTFPCSSPTYSNGNIYAMLSYSGLFCIDAITGVTKWKTLSGISDTNPAIVNGIIYSSSLEGSLVAAFDTLGNVLWYHNSFGNSSPSVYNNTVYVTGAAPNASSMLHAYNISDGKEIWNNNSLSPTSVRPGNSCYVSNGIVYVNNSISANTISLDLGSMYAFDANTGKNLWKTMNLNDNYGSPIVVNGILYASNRNNLYALDAVTGSTKWIFQGDNQINTGPCAVDNAGKVYYVSESGDQN